VFIIYDYTELSVVRSVCKNVVCTTAIVKFPFEMCEIRKMSWFCIAVRKEIGQKILS